MTGLFARPGTLANALIARAHAQPECLALRFLDAKSSTQLSYRELHERANAIAVKLRERAADGDRVVLLLQSGPEYVASFFACLYAGVIAIPAYPPESVRKQHLRRLVSIVGDAQPRMVLTTQELARSLAALDMQVASRPEWIAVEQIESSAAGATRLPPVDPDAIAFLQYTSGSTSTPKGVQVSHRNLEANEWAIRCAYGIRDDDVVVSWLPLFHDMGLIGGLLQGIYSGIPVVLMSPQHFVGRPLRWLDAISRYGGTISGGPDFAYRLCSELIHRDRLSGLDLSKWRLAFTGSEPIRQDSLLAFAEKFSVCGFQSSAYLASYGLAEATLFVTGASPGQGASALQVAPTALADGVIVPGSGATFVSCGREQAEHAVRIAEPISGAPLIEERVGEIWVSGPSITRGYWQRPKETAETFIEHDGRTWLRTGDLGFQRRGELFVTGRRKDLLILRGQNLYPQDIERTVEEEIAESHKGRVAAFGVTVDGSEGVGVAAEISRRTSQRVSLDELMQRIRQAVADAHHEVPSVVVLLNPGTLPRTSSGKLQRSACRSQLEAGTLEPIAVSRVAELKTRETPADSAALTSRITRAWCEHLAASNAGLDDDFFASGGNSVRALQLIAAMSDELDVSLELNGLYRAPTLREFIAAVERALEAARPEGDRIPRAPRDQPLPQSVAQERLWLEWQLDPYSAAYNIPAGLRLRGQLDQDALRKSFDQLIARHESLRTTFHERDGRGFQRVSEICDWQLEREDLTSLPSEHRSARASQLRELDAYTPFDLERGPLFRVKLIVLGDEEAWLLFTLHHLAADGWSLNLLLTELAQLYGGQVNGQPVRLPELPAQCADYAAWERAALGPTDGSSGEAEDAEPLALPLDHPARRMDALEAQRFSLQLDAALCRAVQATARQNGTTVFSVLLAAFQTLLHRYSGGQSSIRLAVPFAGRSHRDALPIVGCFIQTRSLRVELDDRLAFEALLARTHEAARRAQERQAEPPAAFEAIFNHQQRDTSALRRLPGLLAAELPWHSRAAKCDLQLHSEEDDQGRIRLSFDYASARFERATIERLAEHYVCIVEQASARPAVTLGELSLTSEAERNRLVAWGRATAQPERVEHPAAAPSSVPAILDACGALLPELLEHRVGQAPTAPAIRDAHGALDYRCLHARANQLALRLRELGVGPDVRVGVMFERSSEWMVALLAVVKAGGAYVPLEPDYPLARLNHMLCDSGATLLLGPKRLLSTLSVPDSVRTLELCRAQLEAEAASPPQLALHPDHLAYVIYTSGSTGLPKGVGISHRALRDRLQWMRAEYAFDSSDVFLQKAPLSFDVSVWECFLPLISGSRAVLAGPGEHRDPQQLVSLIREHGVTAIHFVPSMLQLFLNEKDVGRCVSLKRLFSGGEVLPADLVRRAQARLPNAVVFNRYGPTEAAINATHWRCGMESDSGVPIGRPLSHTICEVRDDGLALSPIGGRGELYLGGSGLARGYLGQPARTAERFVPADGGGRLYRSGDHARWNDAGALEFLGRADGQVKLRGTRIEVAEVRAQLLAQPELLDAVVVVDDALRGPQLVAYVVAASTESDAELSARLKVGLAQTLPDFMRPSHFVRLAALPLTPSGKLDRRALPDPAIAAREYVAPRNESERSVAEIWQTVLGQDRIGLDDDFFELGGHSLLATQIVSRTRQHFGIELSIRDLFDASRLSAFAQRVARVASEGQLDRYGPIARVDRNRRMPLSYSQQRMWFLWQLDPQSPAYNVGGAVRMAGALDADQLARALQALIERHETLRTSFPSEDGKPYQQIASESPVQLSRVDLSALSDEARQARLQRLADEQAHEPFDLEHGPLLRVCLAHCSASEHHLLVTLHHVVAEGWAMNIFARELTELYEARAAGREAVLPELTVQYLDYVAWQREWLERGELQRQLDYWTAELSGEQPVLELPSDRPRPAVQTDRGDLHRFEVDPALVRALRSFNAEHGLTSFMTVTAALAILLYRYSGQNDLRIGVPVANRVRPESERLIGAFLNTLVLRARPEGRLTVRELLRQVRDSVIEGQSHQELPFDQLVEALRPQRSASHHPLFQVMCNVQSWDFQQTRELSDGLRIEYRANDARATKFDLYLEVTEIDERLRCCLTYSADLFDLDRIERMGRHWQNLLQAMITAPETRLSELAMVGVEERRSLLRPVAAELAEEPFSSVQAMFEARVLDDPRAPALSVGGETLSYAELNERANRLAHRLIELGVGPEVRVGLALERSPEMLVSLLAILKAGGAYVPLDPEYPEERLSYMVQDAGLALLLANVELLERLSPLPAGVAAWSPERDGAALLSRSVDNPAARVAPEHLAYLIYTSGSTGQPKGVAVAHGPLAMHCRAVRECFGMRPDDCELHFYSINFDAASERLLVPLVSGSQLVLRAQGQWDAQEICRLIRWHRPSVLGFTPSYGSQLAHWLTARGETLPVRLCITGGEALTPEHVHGIREAFAPQDLFNAYGPTETVVMPLAYRVPNPVDADATTIPIGHVVGARQLYVLDADLALLPAGAIGELYVGGFGLARAYHERPGLSADRFVADPFDLEGGGRLYRTGDRVRQRRDGTLEYIGRIDQQVKIRGFRIELGEIEARLQAHDEVGEAAVRVVEGPSSRQLAAYVIPARPEVLLGDEVLQAALRERFDEHLQSGLPEYMVPAHILLLERFPLTANGKLDRAALPAPGLRRADHGGGRPRGETERRLLAIWQDVLGRAELGVEDNFFELGGDSILSIQVVSRARQAGIQFSAKDLVRHQTVRGLAGVAQTSEFVATDTGPLTGSTSLTPIQHWFFGLDSTRPEHWNQSVLLECRERLEPERLRRALHRIVEHHDALRLRFSRTPDERWTAAYGSPQPEDELLWVRPDEGAAVRLVCFEEAQRSLDLTAGPLLRAVLIDGEPQRLLLAIHHLAVDGVSFRVLLEDLQSAYRRVERSDALPPRTSSLRAWAERLRDEAASDALRDELGFWQQQSTGIAELPCDGPKGASFERSARRLTMTLDAERTRLLLHAATRAYRTRVDELLLVALVRALSNGPCESSILVQVEGHGRVELFPDIDLSRTVGWFTSAYPVRLSCAESLGESVKRIKEQLRAVPRNGLGYGMLRELGDEPTRAAMAALPEAQVSFNYLGQFDAGFGADALFGPLDEPTGHKHDPDARLPQPLMLDSLCSGGELQTRWTFSDQVFRLETVANFAERFQRELAAVIEHCSREGAGGVTPSDFPLAKLTQEQLDALPIPFDRIEDVYPLTPMQEGLLLHSLLDPGTGLYFMQDRYSIDSELDVERFDRAWRGVIERHEALRASFCWNAGETMLQIIHRGSDDGVEFLDWSELPEAEHELRLQRLLEGERSAGFDLLHRPPLRLRLIRLARARHWFIMSNHHIIIDAWCRSILMGDFFEIYRALDAGVAPELAQPPRYRDFIAWVRAQGLESSKAEWRRALAGFDQASELPADRPIVHDKGGMRVADRFDRLDATVVARLRQLSQQHQLTLNTFAQAAWALVLQRYNTGRDVLFGVTVAGRPASLPAMQSAVGLFINTIPLRVSLPEAGEKLRVRDWLQSLLAQNLDLREHEHVPLVDIQDGSELPKGRPLFDSMLVFENAPVETAVLDRAQSLNARSGSGRTHTNYPLTAVCYPGESLGLHLSYDQRFFDVATIDRLLGEWKRLLAALLDSFHGEFAALPRISDAERRVLLDVGNRTARDYPLDHGYVPLFEAQVAAHPKRVVASCAGEAWTYADLERSANRLGHRLLRSGVAPDQAVALLGDRGLPLLGMIVGCFKAGAGYVPLDPFHPEQRMLEILRSSRARVLVCSEAYRGAAERSISRFAEAERPRLLVWEAVQATEVAEHAPGVRVTGQNLAYVIFTSGSTGRPKGVMVEQAGMLNNQLSKPPYLALSERDVIAQTASQCFDISVWQFLTAPLCGARVEIVPDAIAHDPAALLAHIETTGITVLESVPALIQGMLAEPPAELAALRHLLPTGEAMAPELARRWLERYPRIRLVNAYGPAECSDDVALFTVDRASTEGVRLPIGTPTDNNRLYLLDVSLEPVPLGATAELFVAGTGVGRGYAGDPARTALTFLPDPYSDAGERLYRTGDLARRGGGGAYEFAGRVDHQVKLRGFRIELGEIEARLHEHAEVAEAAVAVQHGAAGSYLVGYVVPVEEARALGERLQAHLRAVLPEYMVPVHWQMLSRLPRNLNGKLDRNALPAIELAGVSRRYLAPRSDLERSLAAIWAEVLKVERVGVTDNFFELGGHSLLATQIASRVQKTMQRGMPLRAMFECSTVEELASYIESQTTAALTEQKVSRISDLMSRLEQRD